MINKVNIRSNIVSVIIIKNNKILLLKRSETSSLSGIWCQVAGRIEGDEKAWEAALREVKEETDLIPDRFYSSDTCEQFYVQDQNTIEIIPVFVMYIDTEQQVKLNNEHTEHNWFTIEEAIEIVPFSSQRKILREIKEEFIERIPTEYLAIKVLL